MPKLARKECGRVDMNMHNQNGTLNFGEWPRAGGTRHQLYFSQNCR